MLIRFEVTNFRSLREPAEISMVAVDREREIVRDFDLLGESLVPLAGIYGPNASGKSNLISALDWLVRAIPESSRSWDEAIPVTPFTFDPSRERPTSFKIELMVNEIRYTYTLELSASHVHYEALWHYPKGRRKKIFEREDEGLTLQSGLGALAGVRKLLTPRSLVLALMHRFESPIVSDFVTQLLRIQVLKEVSISLPSMGSGILFTEESSFAKAGVERQKALELLRLADLGVSDVRIDEIRQFDPATGKETIDERLSLLHYTSSGEAALDFRLESEGTQAWFMRIGPILRALSLGSLLVIDELDSSLHPLLASEILRLFASPETNPSGAQLIFSAHDTHLLAHLNRDELWLTEKSKDGGTRIGALAEFAGESVRKSVNLESAYLTGRFGSLPQIYRGGVLDLLAALD